MSKKKERAEDSMFPLRRGQKQDFDLFNFGPVPMWAYDIDTLKILAANEAAQKDYGYTLDEFLNLTVKVLWPEEDVPMLMQLIDEKVKTKLPNKGELRHIKKDGTIIHVDMESRPLPSWGDNIRIIMAIDVTPYKILNDLEALEKSVFEVNSKSDSVLTEVLSYYLRGIESLLPGTRCAIMQIKKGRLYSWAESSLPERFTKEIEGVQIGAYSGSCGAAAFFKETVIVADIANDPRWEHYQQLALDANLLACWSMPIIDSSGEVMATFAIYYSEVMQPNEDELKIIERASALLNVILENRQYADALKSSNERYSYVNKATNDAIFDWDMLTNHLEWGESFFRLFGYQPDQEKFPLERWLEMVHPEDVKETRQALWDALGDTKGNTWAVEYRLKRADGTFAFIEENGYILRSKEGEAIRMIGVLRDISERMKHELEIKKHLERYNAVSIATSDTIWDYNFLTNEVIWNNGIKEIFGHDEVDGVYQWWYDHVHPDDVEAIASIVISCKLEKRSRWMAEYRFRCKDGDYKFVLDRGFLLFDQDGEAVRMIGAIQDITERVKYIQTIEGHNTKLKEIAWAQTHLVRAPLAQILGLVHLLQSSTDENQVDQQILDYLSESARDLDGIITRIIGESQI